MFNVAGVGYLGRISVTSPGLWIGNREISLYRGEGISRDLQWMQTPPSHRPYKVRLPSESASVIFRIAFFTSVAFQEVSALPTYSTFCVYIHLRLPLHHNPGYVHYDSRLTLCALDDWLPWNIR